MDGERDEGRGGRQMEESGRRGGGGLDRERRGEKETKKRGGRENDKQRAEREKEREREEREKERERGYRREGAREMETNRRRARNRGVKDLWTGGVSEWLRQPK